MAEAAFWALVGASSLLIGAGAAILFRPQRRTIGLVMAFGAGAMISAVAFELVEEALRTEALLNVAIGMSLGALAFFGGDLVIDRMGGAARKRSGGQQAEGSPLAIVLGAVLDGIPESIIVGLSIVLGGGVSASFVAATFLSNFPEAVAATTGLVQARWRNVRIAGLWVAVVIVSALAAPIGFALFEGEPGAGGAFVQAFAAGALLTMLADTMMPEAFEKAGPLTGLATVLGFALAFYLAQFE